LASHAALSIALHEVACATAQKEHSMHLTGVHFGPPFTDRTTMHYFFLHVSFLFKKNVQEKVRKREEKE